MDINEAIVHARQIAEREGCPAGSGDCAYQHDQLADWLEKLVAYMDTGLEPQEVKNMHNELCLKCGNYERERLGACNGCRWKKEET